MAAATTKILSFIHSFTLNQIIYVLPLYNYYDPNSMIRATGQKYNFIDYS